MISTTVPNILPWDSTWISLFGVEEKPDAEP